MNCKPAAFQVVGMAAAGSMLRAAGGRGNVGWPCSARAQPACCAMHPGQVGGFVQLRQQLWQARCLLKVSFSQGGLHQ